jgi:phage terminase small subunit
MWATMSSYRSDLRLLGATPQRLSPPEDLAPAEKRIFVDIVGSIEPKHFTPSDMPLLVSYCVAINQEREANHHLRTEGHVIAGKPSPWIVVQEKAHRMMAALSMRLRLAPQSRARTKIKPDQVSAYDRIAALEGEDDARD